MLNIYFFLIRRDSCFSSRPKTAGAFTDALHATTIIKYTGSRLLAIRAIQNFLACVKQTVVSIMS